MNKPFHPSMLLPEERVVSIDIFRGLTILLMIFVNDVAGISGVPWWLKHADEVSWLSTDGMTLVDLVFPAFLFIVGMSIPFAFDRRLSSGVGMLDQLGHILLRTLGLLTIGVFMVNMGRYDATTAILSRSSWIILFFSSVILVWNRYPRQGKGYVLGWVFRSLGFILLGFLAWSYRGTLSEGTVWMRTSWWGILGLIGWSYLTASLIYLIIRKCFSFHLLALFVLVAINIGDRCGASIPLGPINDYIWMAGQIGGHTTLTQAGVILGLLFMETTPAPTPSRRIGWMLGFAAVLAVLGYFFDPLEPARLFGISKNNATPSWTLYSAAICTVVYAFIYWIADICQFRGWAAPVRPAGSNPLLAYILPNLVLSFLGIVGITWLSTHLKSGSVGILRSLIFAFFIVGVTALLSRLSIRLKL